MVQWAGLQYVIVSFLGQTLLFVLNTVAEMVTANLSAEEIKKIIR